MSIKNYSIIGRYMDGTEVKAYELAGEDGHKRYSKEQVYFLVGKGVVTNCTGQLYNGDVLLRGKGISINDLPVVDEKDGTLKRKDNLGKIAKGTDSVSAMAQFLIVGNIVAGKNKVGYTLKNAGGAMKDFSREDVIKMAVDKKVGNARVQKNNVGGFILRGVECDLNKLPVKVAE